MSNSAAIARERAHAAEDFWPVAAAAHPGAPVDIGDWRPTIRDVETASIWARRRRRHSHRAHRWRERRHQDGQ